MKSKSSSRIRAKVLTDLAVNNINVDLGFGTHILWDRLEIIHGVSLCLQLLILLPLPYLPFQHAIDSFVVHPDVTNSYVVESHIVLLTGSPAWIPVIQKEERVETLL